MTHNSTKARKALTLDKQGFLSMGGSSCLVLLGYLPQVGGRRGGRGGRRGSPCSGAAPPSLDLLWWQQLQLALAHPVARYFFSSLLLLLFLVLTHFHKLKISQWGRWTYCSTFAKTRYALAFTHLCLAFARFLRFQYFL